ncbi:MAG: deoxyribodipyrimidine photo-lyase, partial [Candidatus Caldatribacteriaceae bacterium]
VYFALTEHFPEANQRHYLFLLEGLKETKEKLAQRGIKMVVEHAYPPEGVVSAARNALILVTDQGYLRIQKQWYKEVARQIPCSFWQVETNVVVPVKVASSHEEYGAYTIRPKIKRKLPYYLIPLSEEKVHHSSLYFPPFPGELDISSPEKVLSLLPLDRSVSLLPNKGGTDRAKEKLQEFIDQKLLYYPKEHSDPSKETLSGMSAYLHFGQISPLFIVWEIMKTPIPETAKEAYLEELIIRRELAMNFVYYNPYYDSFLGLPSWARETLKKHQKDPRKYRYQLEDFENAQTHDPLWNAAQKELILSGTIHGYVRMYWGKKVLEWSTDPEEAFTHLLYLNNKYALDGRDPNSFAGIAWCFGKHDRAFGERPIFGKVRYFGKGAMRTKSIEQSYLKRIERMENP